MTDPQKLVQAYRHAKAASQQAVDAVQAAKEVLSQANVRERVLGEAVRLHVEEEMDPVQAKLTVERDDSYKFMEADKDATMNAKRMIKAALDKAKKASGQ